MKDADGWAFISFWCEFLRIIVHGIQFINDLKNILKYTLLLLKI